MKPDNSTPYYNIKWLNFVYKHSTQSTSRHSFTLICIVLFFPNDFCWQFNFEAYFSILDWNIFMRTDNSPAKIQNLHPPNTALRVYHYTHTILSNNVPTSWLPINFSYSQSTWPTPCMLHVSSINTLTTLSEVYEMWTLSFFITVFSLYLLRWTFLNRGDFPKSKNLPLPPPTSNSLSLLPLEFKIMKD